MRHFDLSLYLVLDPDLCAGFGMIETAREASRGGATMVQLRAKSASTGERVAIGRELRAALRGSGVPLVVNDDVEAALAIGADGVHVGQEDMDPRALRSMIGPDMILGLSAETEVLARAVDPELVDYAGLGPVFATATKPDHRPAIGLDGLAGLVAACSVPSVAIGGLSAEHAAPVFRAGASGLAVVSAICGQGDPFDATRRLAEAIAEAGRVSAEPRRSKR